MLSTLDPESGRSLYEFKISLPYIVVPGQPETQSETLSQKKCGSKCGFVQCLLADAPD